MDRGQMLDLLHEQADDALETLVALAPVISELRLGGNLSARTFGQFHQAGLPATLVIQSKPGRRERERVEASVTTGSTVQLALDFDALRTA